MFVRALYIQSDLRKDTENWFNALQKALCVSRLYSSCISLDGVGLIYGKGWETCYSVPYTSQS